MTRCARLLLLDQERFAHVGAEERVQERAVARLRGSGSLVRCGDQLRVG